MGAIFAIVEMIMALAIQATVLLISEVILPVGSFLVRALFFAIGAYPKAFLIGGGVILLVFLLLRFVG